MTRMEPRPGVYRILTLLLLLGCVSCGGTASGPAGTPVAQSLPPLASLDSLQRGVSAQGAIDVTEPLQQFSTSAVDGKLALVPFAGRLAYAIYRYDPPVDAVTSIAASGIDGLWLLLADFSTGKWVAANQFAGGIALADLTSLGQPLSDSGYLYCAVVAPFGIQGQLTSLAVNYNGPQNIYYVAPPADGGDDANNGSAGAPWATLNFASSQVTADTLVIVRPGSYSSLSVIASGTETGPIIFSAEPGATIEGGIAGSGITVQSLSGELAYVVIEGFTITGGYGTGILVSGNDVRAHDITLRGNTCVNRLVHGIRITDADQVLVEDNECYGSSLGFGITVDNSNFCSLKSNHCYDNGASQIACLGGSEDILLEGNTCSGEGYCIAITDAGSRSTLRGNSLSDSANALIYCNGPLEDLLIEGNTCNGNTTAAPSVNVIGLTNSSIRNNLIYGNLNGIVLGNEGSEFCTGNTLANNTIVQATDQGSCIWLLDGCTGNKVYNNILLCGGSGFGALELNSAALSGLASDHNVCNDSFRLDGNSLTLAQWQATTLRDTASQVSTPLLLFSDPGGNDYHLLPACPAVSLALVDYLPPSDLDGIARPQGAAGDCGCYELLP